MHRQKQCSEGLLYPPVSRMPINYLKPNDMNIKLSLIVLLGLLLYGNNQVHAQNSLQPSVVKGTITDTRGEPLQGVRVNIKGSRIVSVSDSKGDYQITLVQSPSVLVFSLLGFVEQEMTVEAGAVADV